MTPTTTQELDQLSNVIAGITDVKQQELDALNTAQTLVATIKQAWTDRDAAVTAQTSLQAQLDDATAQIATLQAVPVETAQPMQAM